MVTQIQKLKQQRALQKQRSLQVQRQINRQAQQRALRKQKTSVRATQSVSVQPQQTEEQKAQIQEQQKIQKEIDSEISSASKTKEYFEKKLAEQIKSKEELTKKGVKSGTHAYQSKVKTIDKLSQQLDDIQFRIQSLKQSGSVLEAESKIKQYQTQQVSARVSSATKQGYQELKQEARKFGIDVAKLERGEVDIQSLPSQSIAFLQQKGLIKTTEIKTTEIKSKEQQGISSFNYSDTRPIITQKEAEKLTPKQREKYNIISGKGSEMDLVKKVDMKKLIYELDLSGNTGTKGISSFNYSDTRPIITQKEAEKLTPKQREKYNIISGKGSEMDVLGKRGMSIMGNKLDFSGIKGLDFGGMGIVSAKSENLKTQKGIKGQDEYITGDSIRTGVSMGTDAGFFSGISDYFNLDTYFQKGIKKEKKITQIKQPIVSAYEEPFSLADVEFKRKLALKSTLPESVGIFFSNLFYNVKERIQPDPVYRVKEPESKDIWSGFKRLGKIKAEKTAYYEEQFGTQEKPFKEIKFIDIQKKQEINQKIEINKKRIAYENVLNKEADNLQKRIDKKEITYDEASQKLTSKTQSINKQFNENVEHIYKKYPSVSNLYRYEGEIIPTISNIAIDIGVGFAGTINPAIPTAYYSLRSVEAMARGKQKEATIYGGMSILSSLGGYFRIGKELTQLRLQELKQIPFRFESKAITEGGGKTLIKISASKSTRLASAEVDILVPIKQLARGKFSIETGKGLANIRVVDYLKQGNKNEILKQVVKFTTAGKGKASKIVSIKTPIGEIILTEKELFRGVGTGYIAPVGSDKIYPFTYGSIAEKTEEGFNIVGGEIGKVRLYKDDLRFTALFKKEQIGKFIDTSDESISEMLIGTTGKKSSDKFLSDLYQIQKEVIKVTPKEQIKLFAPSVIKKAEGLAIKQIIKPSSSFKVMLLGTGAKAIIKTEQKGWIIPKVRQEIISAQKLSKDVKTKQKQFLKTQQVNINKLTESIIDSQISKSAQKLKQPLLLKQEQVTIPQTFFPAIPKISFDPKFKLPKLPIMKYPKSKDERFIIPKKAKAKAHILEIKSKNKWKKVGKPFPSEKEAMNVGVYVTDKTLPAQFRVRPTNKKSTSKRQFNIPINYEQNYGFKFRPYKIRKGVKRPMKKRFIEKRKFRLDTSGEVNKIQLEKWLAQQRRQNKPLFSFIPKTKVKRNNQKYKMPDITGYSSKIKII